MDETCAELCVCVHCFETELPAVLNLAIGSPRLLLPKVSTSTSEKVSKVLVLMKI